MSRRNLEKSNKPRCKAVSRNSHAKQLAEHWRVTTLEKANKPRCKAVLRNSHAEQFAERWRVATMKKPINRTAKRFLQQLRMATSGALARRNLEKSNNPRCKAVFATITLIN
ncbi:MAG: hypothetical protein ACI4JT_07590 [Oscillospiraceae bacterium]